MDVGEEKTSVSCVEDGISHRNTRVRMDYGGGDITQTFLWLLQKCAFPYKACDPSNRLDALLLDQLKRDFCHVNLDVCGSQEKTFSVRKPNMPVENYTIQVNIKNFKLYKSYNDTKQYFNDFRLVMNVLLLH